MIGIYKFTNKFNRKTYIGKSTDIETRYKTHLKNANSGVNTYFYTALRKYGPQNFDFDILIECPVENLNYWEKFYIKYYCSNIKRYGYNMTEGGDGVTYWSEEMREKVRKEQEKRFSNEEYREFIKNIGIKGNFNLHDKLNNDELYKEQWKNKISQGRKKYFSSPEARLNASISQKKYWSTHTCPIKGKHRIWDDEEHVKFHYE